ncbi:MAG: hypothetical protein JST40_05730 [Armatimonadetes bacterium]|nr:hypothetical protein [Armatimonadota bacterium]
MKLKTGILAPIRNAALILALVLLPIAGCSEQTPQSKSNLSATDPGQPSLAINLAGLADWNTELPFVDVFRLSRTWISQREGAGWGQGPKLNLDASGWVKSLEPGTWAETPMNTIEGGHYPSGTYTVLYDGKGELGMFNARVTANEQGRMEFEADSQKGGFFLKILKTDPNDYVRNIRVYLPGHGPKSAPGGFNPTFLKRWKGVSAIRFMDWMATNDSKIARWSDRPKVSDATWTNKGAPVETMVDLSNRIGADPWFCMPHLADDDYVRNFAKTVKETLDPSRRVFIEYSNEVWNSQFAQCKYACDQGLALKLDPQPWGAGWRYTAQRSVEIFKIWEEVFGGHQRLVRILPGFAANDFVSEQVVTWNDAYKHADALAIAPYMGFVAGPNTTPNDSEVQDWNLDQLFRALESQALPTALEFVDKNARIAKKYSLELLAYEGGQHLVGIQGGENNDKVTRLFHQANADPRMGKLYDAYFAHWKKKGGGLFAYFSSVSNWSKWGSWGALQYADENPSNSPKWQAISRFAKSCGQVLGAP